MWRTALLKAKRVNSFPKFTSYSKNIELKNIFPISTIEEDIFYKEKILSLMEE